MKTDLGSPNPKDNLFSLLIHMYGIWDTFKAIDVNGK